MLISPIILTIALAATLPEVAAWHDAVKRAESKQGSVERAFEAARDVHRALFLIRGRDMVIEALPDAEFENLARELLPGILINRDEVILAQPDAKFFLDLARKHGDAADVSFFENYLATFPDSVWPSYIVQQTDVTGCRDFGNGELVKRYAGWRKFRAAHPRRYAGEVSERMKLIESEVAESTCACGDSASVLGALQRFLKSFPDASVAKKVRARIDAIRNSKSKIRFNCLSG